MRIGTGYDSHRLEEGRPLIIGGVTIPHDRGLQGHSDADLLCHAVIDALLGAAHLGNIGARFPDTDPTYKGADSLMLLGRTAALLRDAGWAVVNIDAVVILERPKLGPYIPAIEAKLAEACGVQPDRVSVKPKTNEGMGPIGAGEGAAALASCLIGPATK